MDLEARTREFFAAHRDLRPEAIMPFFAPQARIVYVGLETVDRGGLERMLHAMHRNLADLGMSVTEMRPGAIVARRNVTFAEWTCEMRRPGRDPVAYAGVHVLSWDREGLVTDVSVYTDPEPIRRLSVGSHAQSPESDAAVADVSLNT